MANGNSHQWQPQLIHRRAGTAFSPESGNSELRVSSLESGDRGSGVWTPKFVVHGPSVRWNGVAMAMAVRLLRHHLGTPVGQCNQKRFASAISAMTSKSTWQPGQPIYLLTRWQCSQFFQLPDSRLRTLDYGLRIADYGQRTTEAQSVLLACLSAVLDINLWVAIFTFDYGRPQNNDRKLSRSRRLARWPASKTISLCCDSHPRSQFPGTRVIVFNGGWDAIVGWYQLIPDLSGPIRVS